MTSHRDTVRVDLTRRALILAAPSLLVPGMALAALAPTPGATEGPFYPVRPPRDDDADLVRVEGAVREAGGDILHLAGRVLDADARPVAGARIEIWQCDANGIYLHPGDRRRASRDAGFQGFGHATAGQGRALRLPHHRAGSLFRAHAAYPTSRCCTVDANGSPPSSIAPTIPGTHPTLCSADWRWTRSAASRWRSDRAPRPPVPPSKPNSTWWFRAL